VAFRHPEFEIAVFDPHLEYWHSGECPWTHCACHSPCTSQKVSGCRWSNASVLPNDLVTSYQALQTALSSATEQCSGCAVPCIRSSS
jgi:hypothetical protein